MANGKILYAVIDQTCILKLAGSIIYTMSADFDRFLKKIIKVPALRSFIVDLTEANYIDSTNLGLLARLHQFTLSKKIEPVMFISANRVINETLRNVGFYKIFNIVENFENLDTNLQEVPPGDYSKAALKKVMLNAHRCLIKLNQANREQFKDVIKFLEEDLNCK